MSNGVSDTPIAERTDKKGNRKIEIIDVAFLNEKGDRVNEVFTGHPLTIQFTYNKQDGVDLSKMIIACNLGDQIGNATALWVSDEIPHDFSQILGNKFCLHIDSLNLRPNNYELYYQISLNTTNSSDFCDVLSNAACLSVLNDSFFGDGVILKENRGYGTLIKATFK